MCPLSPDLTGRTLPVRHWRVPGCQVACYLLAVCGLVALLLLPAPTLAQGTGPTREQRLITHEHTPLRQTPSETGDLLAALPTGTPVWRQGETPGGDWFRVQVADDGLMGWVPAGALSEVALLVAREGVALRLAPVTAAPFVRVLPAGSEAWAFASETSEEQVWRRVWTAGGVIGWAPADQFAPYRVTSGEPLSLYAQPSGEGDSVAALPAGMAAVVLEVTPDGAWTRLQTPHGAAGWVESGSLRPLPIAAEGEVRLTQDVRSAGANLRAAPGMNAPVVEGIQHGTLVLVVGRDASGAWLFIITPEGRLAWLHSSLVYLERAGLATLPGIDPADYAR